jgi:hypothetical protein
LEVALGAEHVFFITEENAEAHEAECPGNVSAPAAAEGDLCVYARALTGGLIPFTTPIDLPGGSHNTPGAGVSGAVLYFSPESAEASSGWGSWAVTAPKKS